ncbi:hypothetical protein [Mycolicibacterium fluoranthenivorans]|uniref:Uncharacterized protein n=1 Tax=Mycolicibacterium fluoranthenivorans TaxID=258505 RepID=A0A7X5U5K9_9MYCO|nr:hypothetical protein [Mycolicibacterium fluoranthenivorans]MCV7354522.1 hypothetical protein [Mycolicibacterium fluoranthenivorans]NIH98870.1 hypothetical protein [Mycolicibacterium fluoranthenivorans]
MSELQDIIATAVEEELSLGGDPKSVASHVLSTLRDEKLAVVRVPDVQHKGPNDTNGTLLIKAARRAEDARYPVGGSNVGRAVAQVLREVAAAAAAD